MTLQAQNYLVPTVVEQTNRGERAYDLYSRLLKDRVIFAGDWPVCTLTAPFGGWLNALKEIVRQRPVSFQKKLFHDNAVRFYELG